MSIPPERHINLLLQKHQFALVGLKDCLKDELTCPEHDDVFLLRFLLSADGDVTKAESAVRSTLKWRTEKADMLRAAKDDSSPGPKYTSFAKYSPTAIHGATMDGDILYIVRAGLANPKALFSELSEEDVIEFMFYRRERVALRCDEATRRTGRLCKAVNVNDLNFATMGKTNRQFSHALTTVAKLGETYYPQFMETVVMINLPVVMKTVMRTMWGFMPKRTQDTLRVCPGRTLQDDISKCPYVRAHIALAELPTFLGGQCQCQASGGCVQGIANNQKESNQEVDADGLSKWTVPAKGKYEVFINVEAGSMVSYALQVEKGTLSSGSVSMDGVLHADGKNLPVLQAEKYQPEQGIFKGEAACPEAGICVFTFSNDSAMWGRNIRYSVSAGEAQASK